MSLEQQSRRFIESELENPEEFLAMIQERAFYKSQKRGFEPGHEMEDWLEAEKELCNQCHYWHQEVD